MTRVEALLAKPATLLCGLVVAAAAGCGDEPAGPCPSAPVAPAIQVVVTAATTGDTLTDAAFGYARQGAYTDSLRVCDRDARGRATVRCAAWGRAGTYEVAVGAAGYTAWDTAGVFVSQGRCANGTVRLDVKLQLPRQGNEGGGE